MPVKFSIPLLLCVIFFACEKPSKPDPASTDVSLSLEKVGDDLSKCMLLDRDMMMILSWTKDGYRITPIDKELNYLNHYQVSNSNTNFLAEGMVLIEHKKYIIYGSKDGYPAWGIVDLKEPVIQFTIQFLSDRKGIFYSASYVNSNNYALVGEILDGADKQNIILKTDASGSFIDSLSFGSSKNDGAVDILYSWKTSKNYILSYTYDGPSGDRDVELREYDFNLNLQRTISFGGEGYEQPEKMVESDGALFICGHTTSFGDPMHDAYLARINQSTLDVDYEKAIKLDGHEGADDIKVTRDGNLAICSFAQMNPYNGGYYALIQPNGVALYQQKFMEYERFYQLQLFDDRVVFLGQIKNDDMDVAVHMKFYSESTVHSPQTTGCCSANY